MPEICIAVHNGMLSAALSVKNIKSYYSAPDTQAFRERIYQDGQTAYPAWYLFGSAAKNITGLVEIYSQQGYNVSICPESGLEFQQLSEFELLDIQFCSAGSNLYNKIKQSDTKISGYLPEILADKGAQARELQRKGLSPYLPVQKSYTRDSTPHLPDSQSNFMIVKDALGSDCRGTDGLPYTVWKKNALAATLPEFLAALPHGRKIIISEFILTCDPHAGMADHVVHKMHFFSARHKNIYTVAPYGDNCQKIVQNCNLPLLHEKGFLTLREFIGQPEYISGRVEKTKSVSKFFGSLDFMAHSRLIFSVDFIIPPDGVPRYLESNKLAATFAEKFNGKERAIIDAYPSFPL